MLKRCSFWLAALALVAGLAVSSVGAAEFDKEKLAAIKPRMQKFIAEAGVNQVPGMVVVVGSSKGVALLEAVGSVDIEGTTPLAPDALYRIASMTKPIVAIGVMQLVDAGKVKVDDPVAKYLPEFQGQLLVTKREGSQVTAQPPERPITVRDLLTHTSGMPGGYPSGYSNLYMDRQLTLAEATLLQSQRPLDFAPGSKWSYCNAGIDTLGRIIEVASGESFQDYLQKHVFAPLGMNDTTFFPSPEQLKRLARLYDFKDGKLVAQTYSLLGPTAHAKHPIPAGGLYSTAADLSKLYAFLLQGAQSKDLTLVSKDSLQAMTAVQTGDLVCGFTPGMGFGYGFAVVRKPEGVHSMMSAGTYGHGGAFGTQGWCDPHQDLFVVLLIQRSGMPNADASPLRGELQRLAVEALKK